MGNTHGIPATTNDEWIVINIPRTCKSHFCGALAIPVDHEADARLVDKAQASVSTSPRTVGILPQCEYDAKIQDFNNTIGRGRQRMMLTVWVSILFVAIVPNCLRFVSDDIEIWMYFVVAYVPILLLFGFIFYYFSNERRKAKEVFAPWKTQYGIDVEWFQGSRFAEARLGFKLPQSLP